MKRYHGIVLFSKDTIQYLRINESKCHVGIRYTPALVDEIDDATIFLGESYPIGEKMYPAPVWKEVIKMNLTDIPVVVERFVLIK